MAGEAQNLERRCVQAVPAATAPVEGENDGGGVARVGGAVEGLGGPVEPAHGEDAVGEAV